MYAYLNTISVVNYVIIAVSVNATSAGEKSCSKKEEHLECYISGVRDSGVRDKLAVALGFI